MKKILILFIVIGCAPACSRQFNDMCPYRDIPESCGHIFREIELTYEYDWKDKAWADEWNFNFEKALKNGHYDSPNCRIIRQYNYYGSQISFSCEYGNYKKVVTKSYDQSIDAVKEVFEETAYEWDNYDFNGEKITYYCDSVPTRTIVKGTSGKGRNKKKIDETEEYIRDTEGKLIATKTYDKKQSLIAETIYKEDSMIVNKYNKGQLISSDKHEYYSYAHEKDNVDAEYTYDEYGNWVTCTKKENGKVTETSVRLITYYNEFYVYRAIDPKRWKLMVDSAVIEHSKKVDSLLQEYH